MIETLTFAPRSKRKGSKERKERKKRKRESEDAGARYEVDNNE